MVGETRRQKGKSDRTGAVVWMSDVETMKPGFDATHPMLSRFSHKLTEERTGKSRDQKAVV